jgi:hypothetical protein
MRTHLAALACLALGVSPALAQAPSEKIKLEVTRAELQVIGQGLMELPFKTSVGIINALQAQLDAHDRAARAKAEAEQGKSPQDKPSE